MPVRLLLADADSIFRASLVPQLEHEGLYQVSAAGSAADARSAAGIGNIALAIIDSGLPESAALAADLRRSGVSVLMLGDESAGLAKPFRISVLLQRLHTLISERAGNSEGVRIGPYLFHPTAKLLEQGPRKIRLTEKET